jgi:DamX protein
MHTEERSPDILSEETAEPARYEGGGASPFFFSTPELAQRLDLIRHLIQNSNLIPLIKAPEGAGKSTLLTRFLQSTPENWVSCHVEATPMLQADQLLGILARGFGVSGEQQDPEAALLRRVDDLLSIGQLPVVVVDDAHQLPPEALSTLLRLHESRGAEKASLAMVIFSLPEIQRSLDDSPEVGGSVMDAIHVLDIPPFNKEQMGQYIGQLLAGKRQDSGLPTGPKLEKAFRDTGGVPGRIKTWLMQQSVQGGDENRPRKGLGPVPPAVMASIAAVVLLLLLTFMYEDEINALFLVEGEGGEDLPLQTATREQVVPLKLPDSTPDLTHVPVVGAGEKPMVSSSMPKLELPEIERPVETSTVGEEAEPLVEVVGAKLVPEQDENTASTDAAVSVQPADEPEAAMEPAISSPASTMPATGKEKGIGSPRPKSTAVTVKPIVVGSKEVKRESWLLKQKPSSYTLQLVGLRDEAGVRRFIQRHPLPGGEIAYFRTDRQGKPWYSVLYGIFSDRDTAVAERAKLPPGLRRTDVWPRSLESVQKELAVH